MKKNLKILVISIVAIVINILMDYLNIFNFVSKNLNFEYQSIIISNLIVIVIFLITYNLIDKRNIEKNSNQNNILKILLVDVYDECNRILALINSDEFLKKYLIPKVDFDKTLDENVIFMKLEQLPFKNESHIMDLFKEGVLDVNYIDTYFNIKSEYQQYISSRITFFDEPKLIKDEKLTLIKMLENELNNLKNELKLNN